jgi:hypothetical protein
MRDLGVFTRKQVPLEELDEFARLFAKRSGQFFEKKRDESVVGSAPNVLYVFDDTNPRNSYFNDDEKLTLESRLGYVPEGYVSIHFTSGDKAFALADQMAHQIAERWGGTINYAGAGGDLAVPPLRGD